MSFSHTSNAPEKLFTYHAGTISGFDMSPVTHLVASTGVDSKYELLHMHCFVIPPFDLFRAGLSYYEEVNTTTFALRAIKDWFIK